MSEGWLAMRGKSDCGKTWGRAGLRTIGRRGGWSALCKLTLGLAMAVSGMRGMCQFARQVDPLLGVDGGGNVFPGPAVPFGMIKPGPDMAAAGDQDANAGWAAEAAIRGFGQTHVSGTGGGPKYGNILLMPTVGGPAMEEAPRVETGAARGEEKASAGYYAITLNDSAIRVEITAARRSAIYRIGYPESGRGNLIFDVGHCLLASPRFGESQSVAATEIRVISPTEVIGSSSVTGGWNKQPNAYTVYFYAKSDTAAAAWGTWLNGEMRPGNKQATGGVGAKSGAWLSFATHAGRPVMVKIGISFLSAGQAKSDERNSRI